MSYICITYCLFEIFVVDDLNAKYSRTFLLFVINISSYRLLESLLRPTCIASVFALYKKIHDPWLKDLGPRVRSTWDNSKNLRILKKSPSLLSHMFGINQMHKILC